MKKTTLLLSSLSLAMALTVAPAVSFAAPAIAAQQQLPSLAPMLQQVMPSVVSINVEGTAKVRMNNPLDSFFGDDSPFCFEGSPFGQSPLCQGGHGHRGGKRMTERSFKALGSGVIINAEKGYVVTNNHVVDNATRIQVQLHDGRKYEATVLGNDESTDIALLQLKDFKNLTQIKISNSDDLKIGDYAVAIGNPFGLGETATFGIVSALGRGSADGAKYESFIQTDAPINRGNSGGALVNLKGELIGLNTAILAPNGGNIGIGFAIPSNMVKNLTGQMIKYGQVKRGELGVIGTEVTADLAKAMKLPTQKGAFISEVVAGSAAQKAGLKAGDVIISINGKKLNSFASFRAEIATLPVGETVKLGVLRNGKERNLSAVIAQSKATNVDANTLYRGIDGAQLSNFVEGKTRAVKVDDVVDNSRASRIGLKAGDIILSANQQPVNDLAALRKVIDSKPPVLALQIQRGNSAIYLVMQ